MDSDYEKELEAEISRELRALPDLHAPDSLMARVLTILEKRSVAPWYRRSWQMWPPGLQWASVLVLLIAFGGLCFVGWKFSHAQPIVLALQRVENWLAGFAAMGHALEVILASVFLVIKNLSVGLIIACLFGLGFGYAVCMGLGTIYLQIALAASAPWNDQRNGSPH